MVVPQPGTGGPSLLASGIPSGLPAPLKPLGLTTSALSGSLHDWVKRVFVAQLVQPGDAVCDLFCGRGGDSAMWAEAGIGSYMGIDFTESALQDAQEDWERCGEPFPATFHRSDPCMADLHAELPEAPTFDAVRCHSHLQDCFLSEATAVRFVANVGALLRPGGFFFGTCPDSSTIWLKYQKVVEASHPKLPPGAHGRAPAGSVIRSSLYSIAFDDSAPFDHERGGFFGIKYQLRFVEDDTLPLHGQLMVHFPTLIRLAEGAGLELLGILNLEDLLEDNRVAFAEELRRRCGAALDPKGRLAQPARELLALHAAFVFQKCESRPPMSFEGRNDSEDTVMADAGPMGLEEGKPLAEAHEGAHPRGQTMEAALTESARNVPLAAIPEQASGQMLPAVHAEGLHRPTDPSAQSAAAEQPQPEASTQQPAAGGESQEPGKGEGEALSLEPLHPMPARITRLAAARKDGGVRGGSSARRVPKKVKGRPVKKPKAEVSRPAEALTESRLTETAPSSDKTEAAGASQRKPEGQGQGEGQERGELPAGRMSMEAEAGDPARDTAHRGMEQAGLTLRSSRQRFTPGDAFQDGRRLGEEGQLGVHSAKQASHRKSPHRTRSDRQGAALDSQ